MTSFLTPGRECTEREIELWIEHVGPVLSIEAACLILAQIFYGPNRCNSRSDGETRPPILAMM